MSITTARTIGERTGSDERRTPQRGKKSARVVCVGNGEFWTTQRQFWLWVREGILTHTGDWPLTGHLEGTRERLIVSVNHVLFDAASPIHKNEVLASYALQRRPARTRRPASDG